MRAFVIADAIDLSAPSEYAPAAIDLSDDLVPFLPNHSVTAFLFGSATFDDVEVVLEGRNDTSVDVWTELASISAPGPVFTDIVLPLEIRVRVTPELSSPVPAGTVSITLLGN